MYLEDLRQEFTELEISIARQRAVLKELEERISTVQAELDAFIFPVLTLPNEITMEIFLQYASDEDHKDDSFPCMAIFLLLSVCRAWRNLAFSVPALWATLDLGTLLYRKGREEMEGFVDTWFSRAGTLALSLNWHGSTVKRWSGQLDAIVCRHAPRLKSLDLCFSEGCISHLTHNMPFPLLQNLDLSNLDRTIAPTPLITPVLTFRDAPNLRRVALERISPASLMLPWGLVETFTALDITPQECLDVLRAAPLLRTFDFYGCSTNNSMIDDEPIVIHSSLTSFLLCNGNREMMQYLAFPALDNLDFGGFAGLDDGIFLPFLLRTRGSLRKFSLCIHGGAKLTLSLHWFRHMMHLTDLDLPDLQSESWSDFVRALNRRHDWRFLPVLKNLTLTNWKVERLDMQLLDALDSRCTITDTEDGHVQVPLRSLRLSWSADLPDDNIPTSDIASLVDRYDVPLRKLQMRGMGIHVGTVDKNYV